MSQQIVLAGSTKRLALSSGQAMRMPIYGHNFTKMRIGLRCSFPATAGLTGTPQLVFGLSAGTVGYADPTTTNFVGVRTTAANWTFGGSAGVNGYFANIDYKVCTRVGSTLTDHASRLGGATLCTLGAEALIRIMLVLQIEKGSPNYTMRMTVPISSGAAQTDVSDLQLTQFMELDDTLSSPGSIIANYSTLASNNTIAASEGPGQLDTICIFWDKISVPFYIDDVAHRLIAA